MVNCNVHMAILPKNAHEQYRLGFHKKLVLVDLLILIIIADARNYFENSYKNDTSNGTPAFSIPALFHKSLLKNNMATSM